MDDTQILTLGLDLEEPWILKDQHLDTEQSTAAQCYWDDQHRGI